jgi:putative protease
MATTPSAARAALAAGADRVYATADDLEVADDWPQGVVPVLPEVCRASDQAQADAFTRPGEPVAVGCVSELALAAERGAEAEVRGMIPIHNLSAATMLAASGARFAWLSCELTLEEIARIARLSPIPVGLVAYGRPRVMTSEHCVLQVADRCAHDCSRCALRTSDAFLKDEWGNLLPVRTDVHGRSRIWLADPIDAIPEVPALAAAGVRRLMVDGTLLSDERLSSEVARLADAVAASVEGRPTPRREAGATPGHLYRELD